MSLFPPDEMPDLPDSVLETAEFSPVEDVILPIVRRRLPGARIYSEIPEPRMFPFAVIRVAPTNQFWTGDMRFIDWASIFVHVFTEDPDGDRKASLFSDAIRVALFRAFREQDSTEHGSLSALRMTNRPTRKSDWATSQGPVQYADLPTSVTRYESLYTIKIRRPFARD
ncbi:hypothetical protein [Puerhibacterium puerhi]|uniref:hypothetical protein n=1 Tax=Puerhibacterium puerhi TaxID=2692623 RepID=UPI0013587B4E|nr:hypothetical protein [Puerhibacterium puerhi]